MATGTIIIATLLAGFMILPRQAGSARHPLLQRLREKGTRPDRIELSLCRRPSFVSTSQLMTEREWRLLRRLDGMTDTRQRRLCPQVQVADIVRVAPNRRSGSREWWQLFHLVSQQHCDVVITDHTRRVITTMTLGGRPHQAPKCQQHGLLLEEALKQVGISPLRGDDEQQLAKRVRAHLCAQRPEVVAWVRGNLLPCVLSGRS